MRIIGIIAISLLLFLVAGFRSVFAQISVISATVRANPLEVSVSAPGTVVVGQWFDVSTDITNLGDLTITNTVATVNVPSGLTVRGQKKKTIGDLAGGQTKTVTWRAKANSAGTFVIQVEASGDLAGEQISSSDTTVISSTASLGHRLLKLIFGA